MSNIENINNPAFIGSNASLLRQTSQIKKEKETPKLKKTKNFKELLKEQFASLNTAENSALIEIDNLSREEAIIALQDIVYSAGDALADQVSPENIAAYRKAVKDFMNYVVSEAYDVKNIIKASIDPRKQKSWTLVKVIDAKLDKLAGELIYNQLKKIEILARIDEIKGLLVDLAG